MKKPPARGGAAPRNALCLVLAVLLSLLCACDNQAQVDPPPASPSVSVSPSPSQAPVLPPDNAPALDDPEVPPVSPSPEPTDPVVEPPVESPHPLFEKEGLEEAVTELLEAIITDDMDKLAQTRAVFDYTRTHITYTGTSDKSNWEEGAYEGLTARKGDCFTYYAVSRALLTALGIDNLEVQRVGGPTSHFWNLVNIGTGWYHFDATPRSSKMPAFVSFMFTDEEAADYTERAGRNYYTFDGTLYPERATGDPAELPADPSPAPEQ